MLNAFICFVISVVVIVLIFASVSAEKERCIKNGGVPTVIQIQVLCLSQSIAIKPE